MLPEDYVIEVKVIDSGVNKGSGTHKVSNGPNQGMGWWKDGPKLSIIVDIFEGKCPDTY